ncbi:MAG: xylose isomerase [Ancalomicrobiaceae bacterium]|nr:xylose isomerase [Ancalomicrobiaceae bacterium]
MNAPVPSYFGLTDPIKYEGPSSTNPLAYHYYDKNRIVAGRSMEDHLRFAVCYWHSFSWPGGDPFGGETFLRPWMHGSDPMAMAKAKADVAFDLFKLLDVPFYTFHDADVAPVGETINEHLSNFAAILDVIEAKQSTAKAKLLWGTANLFSHRRFMAGAATNPDPDVFAFSAATVRACLEATHRLGGQNYVLWGGREGYETILNTDIGREYQQMGRFLSMVVEHKHKIGFKGPILIEPKPREPSKHQYDYDVATVFGFLEKWGLTDDVKVNIEQNHAILAGHSFEHEIALAYALGIFGSVDLNRGDALLGWDTDQFAMDAGELTLVLHEMLKHGGFSTGGFNFDAKIRRQSIDPIDLVQAHVGSIDIAARALVNAEKLLNDGVLTKIVNDRYAGWDSAESQAILAGKRTLAEVADRAIAADLSPKPRSGRQEYIETLVARSL